MENRSFGRGRRIADTVAPLDSNEASSSVDDVSSVSSVPLSFGRGRYRSSLSTVGAPNVPNVLAPVPSSETVLTSPRTNGRGNVAPPVSSVASSSTSLPIRSLGRGRLGALHPEANTNQNNPPLRPTNSEAIPSSDETHSADLSEDINNLSISHEPVIRRGTCGTQTQLLTNAVGIRFDADKGVYLYRVKFTPDLDSKRARFGALTQHFQKTRGLRCFDGGSMLYLPTQLPNAVNRYDCTHIFDNTPVQMEVTFSRKLTIKETAPLLNILFNNMQKELKLVRVGKSYYNNLKAEKIPQCGLEIWPGFVSSITEKENGVYLTCDLSNRVLRSHTVLNILRIASKTGRNFKEDASKELIGAVVATFYNNEFYKVDDIDWDSTPKSTFTNTKGETISLLDYYKNKHNLVIEDREQPLLVSRGKKRFVNGVKVEPSMVLLVPELCRMTGLNDEMRKDFRLMKMLATYTKLSPEQRNKNLCQFLRTIKDNEMCRGMLEEWGITLSDEATPLEGRILPQIMLQFGNEQSVAVSADWGRDVSKNSIFRTVDINNWSIIFDPRDDRKAQLLESNVKRISPGMGCRVAQPMMYRLKSKQIPEILNAMKECANKGAETLVVILPMNRDDVYAAVKKYSIGDLGIASQVVLAGTLSREDKARSIIQKIWLQILAKNGGGLWGMRTPVKRLMVCGIDSYHGAGCPSVGAFVASLNESYTSYYSKAMYHKPGQELISDLKTATAEALRAYHNRNNFLPDHIIVYRDGVSDGELKISTEFEMEQIRGGCWILNDNYKPKITFVIVQKRISDRIYKREGRMLENPLPGTVLDHTVTKRNWYDFLIVAQHVRQGTVTPTHYTITYDDSSLIPDHLQRLTYSFCHMYFNWSGTVRVPAPCLYAHKLAFFVGAVMQKKVPNDSLSEYLYYL